MTNHVTILIALVVVLGSEYAKYNFAQDIGETFPDRSNNGFNGTNGNSHLDIQKNLSQQIHRGIYNYGQWNQYALCPSEPLTSASIDLISTESNFSIGFFLYIDTISDSSQLVSICGSEWTWATDTDLAIDIGNNSEKIIITCRKVASQPSWTQCGKWNRPNWLSGWNFLNFVIWYDTDRTKVELFINGVSRGEEDTGAGGLESAGGYRQFRIGRQLYGFISHVVIMTPGLDQDMTTYFYDNSGSWSGLDACMIDPVKVIPGNCGSISKTSDCQVDWECTQCQLTASDWDPCAHCPQQCSSCRYNYVTLVYDCISLHDDFVIVEDSGSYSCSCVNGGGFEASNSKTLEEYWCHGSWSTWTGTANTDCETCTDADASVADPPGVCECNEGFYITDNVNVECSECLGSWRTWAGTATQWQSCSDADASTDGSGSCECNEGFYSTDTVNVVCDECHASWKAWVGDANTQWSSCKDDHASITSTGTCECIAGYHTIDVNNISCGACDEIWETWNGATDSDCLSCNDANAETDSPGRCECKDGYATASLNGSCSIICHSSWNTWTGFSNTEWESCTDPNAQLQSTGTCECKGGYYTYDNVNISCSTCHAVCRTWVSSSRDDWTSCSSENTQLWTIPGTCICLNGYYLDNLNIWQAWNPVCSSCEGPEENAWLSCVDQYAMLQSGFWVCMGGYYDSDGSNGLTCSPCAPVWESCYGQSNKEWVTWAVEYFELPDTSTECSLNCPLNYWGNATARKCQLCDESCAQCSTSVGCVCAAGYYLGIFECLYCQGSCLTCDDISTCTSCKTGHVFDDGQCTPCSDYEGYTSGLANPTGSTVESLWQSLWGDGILIAVENWDDGNLTNGDGWSSVCETEPGFVWDGSEGCIDIKAPSVELTQQQLSANDYTLLLYFSEPMVISGNLEDNVDVKLSGAITAFTWSLDTTDTKDYNAYELLLTVTADVPENTKCTVNINITINDISGNPLDNYEPTATLDSKISVLQPSVIACVAAVTSAASISGATTTIVDPRASAASSSASGCFALMSFNTARFWMLVELMQIMNYLLYITLPTPDILQQFFRILSLSNFSFVPNIFEFFVQESNLPAPAKFEEEEVATNFLLTAGDVLGVVIINLCLLAVVTLIAFIKPTPGIQKKKSLLLYVTPFRIAVEGYLDFSLAIALQSRNLFEDSVSNIFGIILSAFTIIAYFVVFTIIYSKIFKCSSSVLDSEAYKEIYGALYEDFKTTHPIYKCFIVAEKARRTTLVVLLVTLTNYPSAQIYSLVAMQTVWIILVISVRPKTTRNANILMIVSDLVILISLWFLWTFLDPDAAEEQKVAATWTILSLLGGLIGVYSLYIFLGSVISLVYSAIKLGKKIGNLARKIKMKIGTRKIHPTTTDRTMCDNSSKSQNLAQVENVLSEQAVADELYLPVSNLRTEISSMYEDPYLVEDPSVFKRVEKP